MSIPTSLLEIIVCPECKGPLDHLHETKQFACVRCKLAYPINDNDTPVLIVEEASPYKPQRQDKKTRRPR